jgi:hypothetical protein
MFREINFSYACMGHVGVCPPVWFGGHRHDFTPHIDHPAKRQELSADKKGS